MSSGGKARFGMMTFVAVIFAIAILIAGVYMVFFTPGQSEQQPSPHAIQQNG